MLVATPGQTASYSTLHNSGTNGGSSSTTTAATSTMKKSSTSSMISGTAKTLNNNNNNHTSSSVTTKSSLISNTNSTKHNNNANTKNDNIVLSKLSNQNKSTALSSREFVSSSKQTATTHSLKAENSTNTASTNNNKHQSFIQTLKDSVQKALISTTGSSSSSIANKHSTDSKIQNNCSNSKTSVNNVTSSSSATSHNANKISTNTSSNTSSNSTQPSSSASVVRGKYFSCSLSKLHTVAPTLIHRYPEERQEASSTDSLHKEMCHFKPIRLVPKTPWKRGSKSRGNSLCFPKASLATKKTDSVLKSNCDVINRKKNQQQNRMQNDKTIIATDGDNNQQENKEFHKIYKPKPSLSCLSTSFNTPNHTSAFVCLIADMKNLVNLQTKNLLSPTLAVESDDTIEELFTRKKQKPIKKQLPEQDTPKTRGGRRTIVKTTAKVKQTNAKLNNISKVLTVAITKAKSRRSVGRAKSKTINMIALASVKAKDKLQNSTSTPVVASDKTKTSTSTNKNSRKRKIAADNQDKNGHQEQISTLSSSALPTKSNSHKSVLTARKSSRLSVKEMSAPTEKRSRYSTSQIASQTSKTSSQKSRKNSTMVVSFSPPMTRSRLRHLTEQGKIVDNALAGLKNRKS